MAEKTDNTRLRADAVQRLGTTLTQMGNLAEGGQQHARAAQLFRDVGDMHGISSCQINIGIVHSMSGDMAGAEDAYRQAIAIGKEAHAPGLMGLASVNLGVLFLNAGRFDEANACYLDALRHFTTVKNELHRAGTLYNIGHLAREQGDQERALTMYTETAELAQHLGQVDIEIGARAGAGLAALSLGRTDVATESLEGVNRLLEQRGNWWFQGRELADALAFRVAVTRDDVPGAVQQLRQAVANVEPRDPYRAAWLVAEVAPTLLSLRHPAGKELLDRFAPRVDEAGYTQLSLRFAEMRASVA
jgi:tetratricopeptide (TPR) repeat protein